VGTVGTVGTACEKLIYIIILRCTHFVPTLRVCTHFCPHFSPYMPVLIKITVILLISALTTVTIPSLVFRFRAKNSRFGYGKIKVGTVGTVGTACEKLMYIIILRCTHFVPTLRVCTHFYPHFLPCTPILIKITVILCAFCTGYSGYKVGTKWVQIKALIYIGF